MEYRSMHIYIISRARACSLSLARAACLSRVREEQTGGDNTATRSSACRRRRGQDRGVGASPCHTSSFCSPFSTAPVRHTHCQPSRTQAWHTNTKSHMHTHTQTHTRTRTRTHIHTHARTHNMSRRSTSKLIHALQHAHGCHCVHERALINRRERDIKKRDKVG